MNSIESKIEQLKKEKNAIILAHYYVNDEVQQIADYIGDSYKLSKIAAEHPADVIVFAGVSFMGESAKILSPDKKVLMPDSTADCAMAHMVTVEKIQKMREQYDDLAVVCYINSTAEIKTVSDVCVTSANAVKIVSKLTEKNIFFVPDGNLGRYVAEKVPDKKFIFNDGYCPIHQAISAEEVEAAKQEHPNAEFLVHPECTSEILEKADYIGSTSGIIEYASKSEKQEFLIGTEIGVFYELKKRNPDKQFYTIRTKPICEDMKLITLEKICDVLENETNQMEVSDEVRSKALHSLDRMLKLSES